jgi:hypothetical protein
MQVQSPVGVFPLHVRRAVLKDGSVVIKTSMGAWESEVRMGREDLPLFASIAVIVGLAFLLGRSTRRRV